MASTSQTSGNDRALFVAALAPRLEKSPEVAGNWKKLFDGSDVGPGWLRHVAQQAAPAPATAAGGEIVLFTSDDLGPLITELLSTRIWPALAAEFGEATLLADPHALTDEVSTALATEVHRLLTALGTEVAARVAAHPS